MPFWLREQMLHKFSSKDFLGDERLEKDIFIYSVYEQKWNAVEWNEWQMHLVKLTVCKKGQLWDISNLVSQIFRQQLSYNFILEPLSFLLSVPFFSNRDWGLADLTGEKIYGRAENLRRLVDSQGVY